MTGRFDEIDRTVSMRRVMKLVAVVFALTVVHGQAPRPVQATVQTQSGLVRGIGTDVRVFKGIPYAAHPQAIADGVHRSHRSRGPTSVMRHSLDLGVPGRRPHARVRWVGPQAKTA